MQIIISAYLGTIQAVVKPFSHRFVLDFFAHDVSYELFQIGEFSTFHCHSLPWLVEIVLILCRKHSG